VFGWHRALQRLNHLINRLETAVTAVDDAVQQLNEATDASAEATDAIAVELEALRAEIANADSAAAEKLIPVIGRLRSEGDRLRGLAQDPANPVPPAPAPEA
jgi:ABC-type transporter Mla subunit MlaD